METLTKSYFAIQFNVLNFEVESLSEREILC